MKKLAIILITGLLIRLLIFTWVVNLPQNGDLLRYADWGRISFLKGLDQTYNKAEIGFGGEPNNQPPGSLYPISASYYLHLKASIVAEKINSSSSPETENIRNRGILYFFMRAPSLISEVLIACMVFIFIRKKGGKNATLATSFIYLNPVLIYNSTVWGQMDAINNLFFLGAVMLISSQKYVRGLSSLAVSCMIKLSVLPLIPLYFVECFKKEPSIKNTVLSLLAALAVFLILTLPISNQPIQWLIHFFYSSAGGELQRITSEAYNFWYVVFSSPFSAKIVPSEKDTFMGLPLAVFGYLIYFLLSIPILLKAFNNKKSNHERTFFYFSLLALISFLFLPKMHERYLYPFFPLMAVAIGFSKKWIWALLSISVIHFLNLFISWDPGYVNFIPYSLLENDWTRWLLSMALIIIFSYIYVIEVLNSLRAKTT